MFLYYLFNPHMCLNKKMHENQSAFYRFWHFPGSKIYYENRYNVKLDIITVLKFIKALDKKIPKVNFPMVSLTKYDVPPTKYDVPLPFNKRNSKGQHMTHCKLAHQSQSQNCATFTSHIWSLL